MHKQFSIFWDNCVQFHGKIKKFLRLSGKMIGIFIVYSKFRIG